MTISSLQLYLLLMNNDEHVNARMYVSFRCMLSNYASLHVLCFKHFMYVHVHGLVSRMFTAMVVSSSSVGGLGMLQYGIRAYIAAWA